VHVLCEQISDWDLAIHARFLPAKVLGHESHDVFPVVNCGLFGEKRSFKLIHANGLAFNLGQVFEVNQIDDDLAIDFLIWQLAIFDQLNRLSFAPRQLIFVAGVKREIFKD